MRPLLLLLPCLLAVSCGVRRAASSSSEAVCARRADTLVRQRSDSLVRHRDLRRHDALLESRTLTYAALPAERVTLRLSLPQFDSLPSGAAYVAGEGRTRLEARREGDALLVTATVDSLPRRVEEHLRVERRDSAVSDLLAGGHRIRQRETSVHDTLHLTRERSSRLRRRPLWVLGAVAVLAVVVMWRRRRA